MKKLVKMLEEGEYTSREIVLSGVCLLLLGIIIGVFFSPKKRTMIGNNNGNNNDGRFIDGSLEDEDE